MVSAKRRIEKIKEACARAQIRIDVMRDDFVPEGIDHGLLSVSEPQRGKPPTPKMKIDWNNLIDGPYWGDVYNNATAEELLWTKKDTLAKIKEWGYPELAERWKALTWKDTGK